jgi:chromosomal replication initiation ATPase DnaA
MAEEKILPSHSLYKKIKNPSIVGCIIEIENDVLTLKCPNKKSLDEINNNIEIMDLLKQQYNTSKIMVKIEEEKLNQHAEPTKQNNNVKRIQSPQFKEEFITEPYFRGPSNDFAYTSIAQVLRSQSGVVVISGNVGVGKTHMMNRFSYKAYKSGLNVYINSTAKFISEIFQEYSNKNYDITNAYLKFDLLALDDFQVIDRQHLQSSIHDIFFDILNSFIMYDKIVLLSCDRHPRSFEFLHKRITDRLWGVRPVEDPDKIIMNKYIRWFKRKHNLKLNGFHNIILNYANTMRMLKEFLYTAKYLEENNALTIKNFEDRVKINISDIHNIILNKLMHHYHVQQSDMYNNARRSSIGTKIISTLVYILYNSNKYDVNKLFIKHNINKKNKSYYLKNGEKYFKSEIENSMIMKEIKELLNNYDNIN